jgi:hypothetical protein
MEANPQAGWAENNNTRMEAWKKITKAKSNTMNNWLPFVIQSLPISFILSANLSNSRMER